MTDDADINLIRQQIENLGNRMIDQFDRVRNDMQLQMKAYVLDVVHQQDLKRLDEKDELQQRQIDILTKQLDGLFMRWLGVFSGSLGTIIGVYTLLRLAHLVP